MYTLFEKIDNRVAITKTWTTSYKLSIVTDKWGRIPTEQWTAGTIALHNQQVELEPGVLV